MANRSLPLRLLTTPNQRLPETSRIYPAFSQTGRPKSTRYITSGWLAILLVHGLLTPTAPGQSTPDESADTVEIQVNVLPGKNSGQSLKFNAQALYNEDEEVLQGVLGGSGNDTVSALLTLPTGELLMAGTFARPVPGLDSIPRCGFSEANSQQGSFLAVFDPRVRTLQKIAFFPERIEKINSLATTPDGSVMVGGNLKEGDELIVFKLSSDLEHSLWQYQVPGKRLRNIAIMQDGSVIVCPARNPFISRIRPDGSGLIPFGNEPHFRTDSVNPQVRQAWYNAQGYDQILSSVTYHHGGVGGVGVTPDGHLVFLSCHFVRHKEGGSPDFDPMLIKFSTDGELLWATHLLEGIPALSDHKHPFLYICPFTGDIIATLRQHGHFDRNMIVGPDAYLTTDNWITGDIMVGWIGRIDPVTGKVKAGTMYFPDLRKPEQGGKRTANTLFPEVACTDQEGNIYVAGKAAFKLSTTMHAFQKEKDGDSGFLSVFNRDLTSLRYANLITGKGYQYDPRALAITSLGPVVGTVLSPDTKSAADHRPVTSNTDKTNYLQETAQGDTDIFLTLLPSLPWKR